MENAISPKQSTPKLKLLLLGNPQIKINGTVFTELKSTKARGLLYYLAVTGQTHSRSFLASLLWGETNESSARGNLRKALQQLRKHFSGYLTTTQDTVSLADHNDCWIDVVEFNTMLLKGPENKSIQNLESAINLFRGDFLIGFFVRNAPEYENWWLSEQSKIRGQMLNTLQSLTDHYSKERNYKKAIALMRRFLELEPWSENAHRSLMELLAKDGQRSAAFAQFAICRDILATELNVEPSLETTALYDQIDVLLPSSTSFQHNLPHPLKSFIGRNDELKKINNLIANHRLVTVTGPGGVGKTNLCLQSGRLLLESFDHGVWIIELASIITPALLPQTAANTLGLSEFPDKRYMEQTLEYLKDRHCLLILDNCEHLIDASVDFVVSILQSCPKLKLLVNSREALGIGGEQQIQLSSLSFPDKDEQATVGEWDQYEAITLFVERAVAVFPDFKVNQKNLNPLMQICRQLDGIPLALELAAGHMDILTIEQIADRLADRFTLLTTDRRGVMPRQQTVRTSIDWSWELLTAAEQALLQQLSVFTGGMSLDAVETICFTNGDEFDSFNAMDLLKKLYKKSMVIITREQEDAPRFKLLDTIRQYAGEQLAASGLEENLRDRHLNYYRQFAEQAREGLFGSRQASVLKALEKDIDNIRAALNWALRTDSEAGLRILTEPWRFWEQGYIQEGDYWLTQLLTNAIEIGPDLRAKALYVQGRFNLFFLQKIERAKVLVAESLELYEISKNKKGIAQCLVLQGWEAGVNGGPLFYRSLEIFKSIGDQLGVAEVLYQLGILEYRDDLSQAMAYLEESESLFYELGHSSMIIETLAARGMIAIHQESYNQARLFFEESLELQERLKLRRTASTLIPLGIIYYHLEEYVRALEYFDQGQIISEKIGDKQMANWAYVRLGYVYLRLGALSKAHMIFTGSLHTFNDAGIMSGVNYAIEGLASLATARGQIDVSARLYSWADASRQSIKDPRPPVEQAEVNKDLVMITESLSTEVYLSASDEGNAMTIEQILSYVSKMTSLDENLI